MSSSFVMSRGVSRPIGFIQMRHVAVTHHRCQGIHRCHVRMAARKGRRDNSDDGEDDAWIDERKGGKKPRSKDVQQVAEEVIEEEDISAFFQSQAEEPVQQRQQQQAEEEAGWPVTRESRPGKGARAPRVEASDEQGAGRAERDGGSGSSWGRRKGTWKGPREGLSASKVEQRLAAGGEIKAAADWQALASFVQRQGERMDAEQAVMVLSKLSCCPQQGVSVDGRAWRSPASSLQPMRAAFGRPKDDDEAAQQYDQQLSILLGWIVLLIPSFRPRQVCRCLAAMDHMNLFNVEVVTALRDAIAKHVINFELADYGAITASFAKFGYNPGPEFVELFSRKIARKLQLMNPEELGKVAHGLAATQSLPCAEWFEAFWKASYEKARDFVSGVSATQNLLMAVASFAQAGQQPSQDWVDSVFGVLPMAGRSNQPPKVALISTLLYTLSNIQCRPSRAWMNTILEAWRRQLRVCSPSDLGTISLYLGRYLGVTVTQDLGAQLLRATLACADKMAVDEIAAVAYLLGVSQLQGDERDVDELVYILKQRLHECSSSSAEMLCSALPSLETSTDLRQQELRELVEEASKWVGKELQQELVAQAA